MKVPKIIISAIGIIGCLLVLTGCPAESAYVIETEVKRLPDKLQYAQYVDSILDLSGGILIEHNSHGESLEVKLDKFGSVSAYSQSENVNFDVPGKYLIADGLIEIEVVPIDDCDWIDVDIKERYKNDSLVDRT